MKKWAKESAAASVKDYVGSNKVLLLDGTASLRKLSAMDYLVNNHGYVYKIVSTEGVK